MKTQRQDLNRSSAGMRPPVSGQFDTGEAEQTASRLQQQVIEAVKQAYESILENASRTVSTLNTRGQAVTRRYPLQVCAGALAIGFLAGAAMVGVLRGARE